MPIPSNKEYDQLKHLPNARQQIQGAYEKWGWERNIEFAWVGWSPLVGMPILSEYSVHGKDLPCSCSAKGEAILVHLASTGINTTCMSCRTTSGPVSRSLLRLTSERLISLAEAERVCRESGQRLPKVIADQLDNKKGMFQIWV